jgi:hypothetical protein
MTSDWFLIGLLGSIASGIGTAAGAVGTAAGTAAKAIGTGALSAAKGIGSAAESVGGGLQGLFGGGGGAASAQPGAITGPSTPASTPGGGIPSGPMQNYTPQTAGAAPAPGGGGGFLHSFLGGVNQTPGATPQGAGGILGQLAGGQSPRGVAWNALTGSGGPFEGFVQGLSPANRALLTAALSQGGRQRQLNVLGNLGSRFAGSPTLGGQAG